MTKFACRSAYSAVDLAVKNDPSTYSIGNQHEDEVTRIPNLGSSEPQLSKGDCIGIIVYGNRQPARLRDHFADRQVTPLKIGNEDYLPSCRSNQSGNTDTDPFNRTLVRKPANNFYDTVQCARGSWISWEGLLLDHNSGQITTRDSRAGGSDINANGNSANRAQSQQRRSPTAG